MLGVPFVVVVWFLFVLLVHVCLSCENIFVCFFNREFLFLRKEYPSYDLGVAGVLRFIVPLCSEHSRLILKFFRTNLIVLTFYVEFLRHPFGCTGISDEQPAHLRDAVLLMLD